METVDLNTSTPACYIITPSPPSAVQDEWPTYGFSPPTPTEYDELDIAYSLPGYSHYEYDSETVPKSDAGVYAGEDDLGQQISGVSRDHDEVLGYL